MKLDSLCAKLLCFVLLSLTTGCHMDGSSFRMDSNSRIPFFGVSFSKNTRAKQPGREAVVRATNDRLNNVSRTANSADSEYWGGTEEAPKRIPLKRTDLKDQSLTSM